MSHKALSEVGQKQRNARLRAVLQDANRTVDANIQNIADRQSPPIQQM